MKPYSYLNTYLKGYKRTPITLSMAQQEQLSKYPLGWLGGSLPVRPQYGGKEQTIRKEKPSIYIP
jgi:hypothetical protein